MCWGTKRIQHDTEHTNMLSATRINITVSTASTSQLCEMTINKLFQNLKQTQRDESYKRTLSFKLRQLQQEFLGFCWKPTFCTTDSVPVLCSSSSDLPSSSPNSDDQNEHRIPLIPGLLSAKVSVWSMGMMWEFRKPVHLLGMRCLWLNQLQVQEADWKFWMTGSCCFFNKWMMKSNIYRKR